MESSDTIEASVETEQQVPTPTTPPATTTVTSETDESEMVENVEDKAKNAEEYKNKGNESYKATDYRKAVEYYTQAIETVSNNPAYYCNRAAAYMMLKQFKESINDTKRSIEFDDKFVKAYLREGKCHLYLGDYNSALRCFDKVKDLEPDNTSVDSDIKTAKLIKQYAELADDAFKRRDFRKVVYLMDRALENATDSKVFKINRAESLAYLGRYQEAQEIANTIVYFDPTDSDAIYVRGVCLYYQDHLDKAFQHFQRVLQYSPDNSKAKAFYKKAKLLQSKKEAGNTAFKSGNYDEAYNLYTESLEIDPDHKSINSILYCNRATVLAKLNKLEQSIEDCTKAIELDDAYLKAYLRRAKSYMETEQFDKAVHDYEKLCKLDKTRENQNLLKDAKLALKKSKRKDYYKILGVSQNASDDDIRKAYRKRAMMHHPDRFPNESEELKREEEKKFKEVGEAYAVLTDAKKRQRYDNGYDLDELDGGGGGGFGHGHGMGDVDPNLLFQAFFGGGGGGGRGGFPF